MKDARILTTIVHGSRLYGTNTPASDNDFKSVHLPSAKAILLGDVKRVIESNTKTDKDQKNTSIDIDNSSYALAKFLKLVVDGDTSGVEILLAPPQFRLTTSSEFEEIFDHRRSLLNNKSKGFVGYCKTQAAKYGIKGSRLKVALKTLAFFEHLTPPEHLSAPKMYHCAEEIRKFAAETDHASIDVITTPSGVEVEHLNVLDRKAPFTVTIKEAKAIFKNIADNYGLRAKQAADNQNVDWKAVSHAVRVGEQALELLTTGELVFPRPNAARLKQIKLGELPYAEVGENLEELLSKVDAIGDKSVLPDTSNMDVVENLIMKFHKSQIQ